MILNIIGFVLTFGIIVAVHEFGHFYFAKKAGILCHEFSFGMGPLLFQTKKGETKYSLRLIPIGGYVAMAGEDASIELVKKGMFVKLDFLDKLVTKIVINDKKNKFSDLKDYEVIASDIYVKDGGEPYITVLVEGIETTFNCKRDGFYYDNDIELQFAPYDRCFESKPRFARFKSIVFGPLANFILAFVIFFVAALINGAPDKNSTIVSSVSSNSPSEVAGMLAGDEIISINGVKVENFDDVYNELSIKNSENYYEIEILRDGETKKIDYNNRYVIYSAGFISGTNGLEITSVTDTIAEEQGLMENDILHSINGVTVSNWQEVTNLFEKNTSGEEMDLVVLRAGEEVEVKLKPYSSELLSTQGVESVSLYTGLKAGREFSLTYALTKPFEEFASSFRQIIDTIKLLFTSDEVGVNQLSGPIGIFRSTASAISGGIVSLLSFAGFLSINVGIVNLLPIPALDGGRILLLLIGFIRRKELSRKFEGILNGVFFALLLLFILYITVFDIIRLF